MSCNVDILPGGIRHCQSFLQASPRNQARFVSSNDSLGITKSIQKSVKQSHIQKCEFTSVKLFADCEKKNAFTLIQRGFDLLQSSPSLQQEAQGQQELSTRANELPLTQPLEQVMDPFLLFSHNVAYRSEPSYYRSLL